MSNNPTYIVRLTFVKKLKREHKKHVKRYRNKAGEYVSFVWKKDVRIAVRLSYFKSIEEAEDYIRRKADYWHKKTKYDTISGSVQKVIGKISSRKYGKIKEGSIGEVQRIFSHSRKEKFPLMNFIQDLNNVIDSIESEFSDRRSIIKFVPIKGKLVRKIRRIGKKRKKRTSWIIPEKEEKKLKKGKGQSRKIISKAILKKKKSKKGKRK